MLLIIDKFRPRPTSLITLRIPPPAHCHWCGRSWRMDTKLRRYLRHLSRKIIDRSIEKRNFYLPHLHLTPSLGVVV